MKRMYRIVIQILKRIFSHIRANRGINFPHALAFIKRSVYKINSKLTSLINRTPITKALFNVFDRVYKKIALKHALFICDCLVIHKMHYDLGPKCGFTEAKNYIDNFKSNFRNKRNLKYLQAVFDYTEKHSKQTPLIERNHDKPLYILHICVWGESYLDKMLQYAVPSLLATGNIPEVHKTHSVVFYIHCDRKSMVSLQNALVIKKLLEFSEIIYVEIPDNLISMAERAEKSFINKLIYLSSNVQCGWKYFLVGCFQNIVKLIAAEHKAFVSFIMPDDLFSDEAIKQMFLELQNGRRAVVTTAFRSEACKVHKLVRSYYDNAVLSIPGPELSNIAVHSMHEAAKNRIVCSKNPRFQITSQLLFHYPNQVVARTLHMHPILVNFSAISQKVPLHYSTIDANFLEEIVDESINISKQLAVCEDVSKIGIIEVSDVSAEKIAPISGKNISQQVLDMVNAPIWSLAHKYVFSKRLKYRYFGYCDAYKSDIRDLDLFSSYSAEQDDATTKICEKFLCEGNISALEQEMASLATEFVLPTGITVPQKAAFGYQAALVVEGISSKYESIFQLDNALRLAENLLRESIELVPLWTELHRALGRNLWFQSKFSEAITVYSRAENLRDEVAKLSNKPIDAKVYLPRNTVAVLGLMGHLDGFIKYKELNNDTREYILLADESSIVNAAFFDYWKPHLTIITDPDEIKKHELDEFVYGVNWHWVMPMMGQIAFVHEGLSKVHNDWDRLGKPPLLKLMDKDNDILTAAKKVWGISSHEKFICLHVRSQSFYGAKSDKSQVFRNATLDNYYPLIQELTKKGYWVIRMGDPTMEPLDIDRCGVSNKVVDYALSLQKSATLDVALCAACELFVTVCSGLYVVSQIFGNRVCGVNYPIQSGLPHHPKHIFIPKLYFSEEKNRILNLEEIVGSDLIHCNQHFLLDRAKVKLLANEPDEITETVLESLDPEGYVVEDQVTVNKVRSTYFALLKKYNRGNSAPIGSYFAIKHADKLLASRTVVEKEHDIIDA